MVLVSANKGGYCGTQRDQRALLRAASVGPKETLARFRGGAVQFPKADLDSQRSMLRGWMTASRTLPPFV